MVDFSAIAAALEGAPQDADLPVERWHPAHCGTMDLVIRADGAWIHEGTPIGRPALVRLLSRVLRRDTEGYVLVTPAEKLSITVEDVPFIGVDVDEQIAGSLDLRTNVGDRVNIGADHPMMVKTPPGRDVPVPYVRIRGDLWARIDRAAYYRLVSMASEDQGELVIESGGERFVLGRTNTEAGL